MLQLAILAYPVLREIKRAFTLVFPCVYLILNVNAKVLQCFFKVQ